MDAPVVWMDAAPEQVPSVLQTWASERGLRLVSPSEGGQHAIAVDPAIATRVEEDLRVAREMTTQHDADRAERSLARAEALLRAHPEIPQAAWLLAEVERGWAARFFQLEPRDVDRAARHWRAAAALDGGRAPGIGEPITAIDPVAAFSIDTQGSAEMIWDGDPITAGAHEARPGMHQLVAKASGEVVFAQWINVTPAMTVHVALPSAEPCSRVDFTAKGSVQCPSWIEAKRGDRAGTFVVRTCAANACGAELLVAPFTNGPEIPPITHPRHGLPVWAAWTLAGVGIVATGIAAGVIGYLATPVTIQHVTETNGKPH